MTEPTSATLATDFWEKLILGLVSALAAAVWGLWKGSFIERITFRKEVRSHLDRLRARCAALARQRKIDPNNPFELRIKLFDHFSEIYEFWKDRPDRVSGTALPGSLCAKEYLASFDKQPGTLLLHAPGGFGKSSILLSLLEGAIKRDIIPFYLDFASSSAELKFRVKDRPDVAEMFRYFSPKANLEFFNRLFDRGKNRRFLLILDSINERPYDWSDLIEQFIHAERIIDPRVSIVIADRMTDRKAVPGVQIASVLPLSSEFLENYVINSPSLGERIDVAPDSEWMRLLEMPFALTLAERVFAGEQGELDPTLIALLLHYFEKEVGILQSEMKDLGDFAFEVYSLAHSTEIDDAQLKAAFPDDQRWEPIYHKLMNAGVLVRSEGEATNARVRFRHQIFHDFAVGYRLAMISPEEEGQFWRNPAFDTATLNAASFEALAFAAQVLAARGDGELTVDRFLTEVYDWNYRAVVDAMLGVGMNLGEAEYGVSDPFRAAIVAVSAWKLFDHFDHTRKGMVESVKRWASEGDRDSLSEHSVTGLIEYVQQISGSLSEHSVSDIVEYVRQMNCFAQTEYWKEWQELFCRSVDARPVSLFDLPYLEKDPVFSWTAANVFRRVSVSKEARVQLLAEYRQSRDERRGDPRAGGFRWRVVHVLGSCPEKDSISLLLDCACDSGEYDWARYGAIRSYIEAVSLVTDRTPRQEHLNELASRLSRICFPEGVDPYRMVPDQLAFYLRASSRLQLEIARCWNFDIEICKLPVGWIEDYGSVLREGVKLMTQLRCRQEVSVWQEQLEQMQKRAETES
jgi:hypothetical protein